MFLLWITLGPVVLAATPPNIVFILSDDQGWNDISWHNEGIITPNLQKLYDSGVRLTNNYVQPLCTPTRSALMTGYYPYHLGRQKSVLDYATPTGLTLNRTLLPEKLSELGYRTHGIGKWHLGFCDWDYTPLRRGFDTFYGFYQGAEDYYTHTIEGGYDFRDLERVAYEANNTYSSFLFGDRAVGIIHEEAEKEGPYFLYLALQNIHTPRQVPEEFLEYYPDDDPETQIYNGMISAMDEVVGRVVEALRSTGQENNTVLIFSSDNGGVTGEKNAPLRGKKGTLWEGGTRVPALMYSPVLENTPREYSGLLHVTDWHNTLLAVAGASIFPENDGFNQWEALRTGLPVYPRDSFIYNLDYEDNEAKGAIRLGQYKFFLGALGEEEPKNWLSDLEDDPNETTNLVEVRPDVAEAMEELLRAQLATLVPADVPPDDDAGNPEYWDGVWEPGWCTAN